MKSFITAVSIGFLSLSSFAQDDSLAKELEALTGAPEKEYVIATFKGTRLINLSTIECAGKNTLDYRISHRFNDVKTGADGFFGLDGPASLRMSFDYCIDGRLMLGIARNSLDKLYEGSVKYKLLRQTTDNKMPVSVTGLLLGNINSSKAPSNQPKRYEYFSSRLSSMVQLMIARKFTRKLSMQLSPTFLHFNLVDAKTDKNDIWALGALGRYKLTGSLAITAEYIARLNTYTAGSDKNYSNSASIGIDIETGGHVFQLNFSNSFGMNEVQFIPYTNSRWDKGEFRFGFNISRSFSF